MKRIYFVGTFEKDGLYVASVLDAGYTDNLLYQFKKYEQDAGIGLHLADIFACESKKRAKEIAEDWNRGYEVNGVYLLDDITRFVIKRS